MKQPDSSIGYLIFVCLVLLLPLVTTILSIGMYVILQKLWNGFEICFPEEKSSRRTPNSNISAPVNSESTPDQ